MLSATFTIFNSTRNLPPRGKMPAWAPQQSTWPQITLLSIACVSLAFSVGVFYAYARGGHRRAEKAAVYYTVFAIAFFIFNIVMWTVGAALLNESRKNGDGKDMWGWSCKDGKRKDVFQQDVNYALVCRLQVSRCGCEALCMIRADIDPLELVTCLRFHRDYCRDHHHRHLRYRILPLLFEETAAQIDERTRQGSLGPVPGAAEDPIRAQHTGLLEESHGNHLPCPRTGRLRR